MKIAKKSDVRRNNILNTAEILFVEKGYHSTSINEILDAVGIAKGTFYHYFDSKEEVLDAIVMRYIDKAVDNIKKLAADKTIGAVEKIRIVITRDYAGTIDESERIKEFKAYKNAELQQKKLCYAIEKATPHIVKIIKQGVKEGVFTIQYPEAAAELLIISAMMIFENGGLFRYTKAEYLNRAEAHSRFMEKRFNVPAGTFNFIYEMFKANLAKTEREGKAPPKRKASGILKRKK